MIDILPHLERLLYRHPVVIMPGLGAFQTAKTDARPDAVGGVINPPARTLTFNENLTADDGLLVEDIAQTHQIAADEARDRRTESGLDGGPAGSTDEGGSP